MAFRFFWHKDRNKILSQARQKPFPIDQLGDQVVGLLSQALALALVAVVQRLGGAAETGVGTGGGAEGEAGAGGGGAASPGGGGKGIPGAGGGGIGIPGAGGIGRGIRPGGGGRFPPSFFFLPSPILCTSTFVGSNLPLNIPIVSTILRMV